VDGPRGGGQPAKARTFARRNALRDGVPQVKTFSDEVSEIEAVYGRVVRAPAALRVKV